MKTISLFFVFLFHLTGVISHASPPRILSMDICSDYYLAQFKSDQPTLFTWQATDGVSLPFRVSPQAKIHHNRLEELIVFRPDIILESFLSYGDTYDKIKKYAYNIQKLPIANNLNELKAIHYKMAQITQNHALAQKLNQKIDHALKQVVQPKNKRILFLGTGYFTIKRGTHYDIITNILGMENYHKGQGFGSINIEKILMDPPDYIIMFGSNPNQPSLHHHILNHPALAQSNIPLLDISGRFTACPTVELIKIAQDLKKQIGEISD